MNSSMLNVADDEMMTIVERSLRNLLHNVGDSVSSLLGYVQIGSVVPDSKSDIGIMCVCVNLCRSILRRFRVHIPYQKYNSWHLQSRLTTNYWLYFPPTQSCLTQLNSEHC